MIQAKVLPIKADPDRVSYIAHEGIRYSGVPSDYFDTQCCREVRKALSKFMSEFDGSDFELTHFFVAQALVNLFNQGVRPFLAWDIIKELRGIAVGQPAKSEFHQLVDIITNTSLSLESRRDAALKLAMSFGAVLPDTKAVTA